MSPLRRGELQVPRDGLSGFPALPFLAAHSPDLVDRLYEGLKLDCRGHRILTL